MSHPKFALLALLLQCDMKAQERDADQPWGIIIALLEIELMHGWRIGMWDMFCRILAM